MIYNVLIKRVTSGETKPQTFAGSKKHKISFINETFCKLYIYDSIPAMR